MKYIKSYLFLVLTAALALTGCKQDDLQDDVDALANRVAILEEQVKLLNENLETISFVLNSENKTIQSVTQSGNAYTLTLSNGETLTLNIGVQGSIDVPEIPEDAEYNSLISISEDGYWVIRGEKTGHKAVGQPGANGSGYPEFRVNDGKWQVRFLSDDGEVTDWKDVEGTANTSIGEIGDQLIAGVDTSDPTRLTITYYTNYSEGTTEEVSLPIVPGLICQIVTNELLDGEGYLQMEAGTIQTLSVKISGGTPQLTYPSGWRATIEDPESDGVYELTIYSPAEDAATASAQSRVSANNTEDVTVRVQSGMYWAVDKVKVRTPKVYANDMEAYLDGATITVGGIDINKQTYGEAKVIGDDETSVTISDATTKVFFVPDGCTLTYNASSDVKTDVIALSKSTLSQVSRAATARPKLVISKQIYVDKTFVCKGMDISYTATSSYPLRLQNADSNVFIDSCTVEGLIVGSGLCMPQTAGTTSINNFTLSNSDIKIDVTGANLYIITNMDTENLSFTNNIVYNKKSSVDENLQNFKVFNGNNRNIGTLDMSSNTFIDVETSGNSGVTGLVYANTVTSAIMNNNLYWLTTLNSAKINCFLRATTSTITGAGNYAYDLSVSGQTLRTLYASGELPSGLTELTSNVKFFDNTNSSKFNKETGVFIPEDGYTQYGAQR